MKKHLSKPRTPMTLAQCVPKDFDLKSANISTSCMNTNDTIVEKGGCSSHVEDESEEVQMYKATSYSAEITFSDEDLLLGGTPHNRPLFVEGYACEKKLKRILIDQGSAVNILSLRALKDLGISIDDLTQSRLMIQGFNQGGQKALGIIRLDLTVGKLSSSTLCHVIDARTSYNLLLGRPWIHENGVIPSSWHQCFMYDKNGVVEKVVADESPFTEAESYLADAKFYMRKQIVVEEIDESGVNAPLEPKWKGKQVVEEHQPSKELVFPLTRIDTLKEHREESLEERSNDETNQVLPTQRTEGFDPNAYKLLAKSGYDSREPQRLGKLIPGAGGKGLPKQQNVHTRKGLGYVPPKPVKIFINRATSNHITIEAQSQDKKQYVFDRIGHMESRQSVFDRLGSSPKEAKRKSAHERLGHVPIIKKHTKSSPVVELSKEIKSAIPSRMRREAVVNISCGEVLKVQPKTIVHTSVQEENEENMRSNYETYQDGQDVNAPQELEGDHMTMVL